jgi:hypothetical protein
MSTPPPVPALPDTKRLTTYSITAQTGPFAVNFALYGDDGDYGNWIDVWLNTGSGESNLVATVDYTLSSITGPVATIARPITDATVTLTVASTGTLYIYGARRPRRTTQFNENTGVPARDLNQAITDIVAEQREAWDFARSRTMYFPGGETVSPTQLPIATTRAGKVLAFDGSGNPSLSAITISGTIGAVALNLTRTQIPTVTVSPNTIIVSGYAAAGDRGAGAMYTSVGAGPSGPGAIQDFSGAWFNLVLNGTANVGWFGAKGDGVTNDVTAIQNTINTLASLGGGNVIFGPGTYAIGSTINVTTSYVQLVGVGADGLHPGSGMVVGSATTLKWIGATSSTTPMVLVATPIGSTYQIVNSGVQGIGFDGGTAAGIGLQVLSVVSGRFESLFVAHVTNAAYWLGVRQVAQITSDAPAVSECQFIRCAWNLIANVGERSANGFYLTGDGIADNGGNVNFCQFRSCVGYVYNGANFLLDNCDNCVFQDCHGFVNGGSGFMFDLHGTNGTTSVGADSNTFIGCSWAQTGGFRIQGTDAGWTQPPTMNYILSLDVGNGSPFPTLGTGASFIGPTSWGVNNFPPTWTPALTPTSGAITSFTVLAAHYRFVGKTVYFSVNITVTNNGTGAGALRLTLPPNGYDLVHSGGHFGSSYCFPGRNETSGVMLIASIATTTSINITKYDNTYPVASGDTFTINGWYIID